MTIVEALKAFYKNSVEDIKKLNDADSVLEVLRAKYGDYKGSNVFEYVQELVENGVEPGSGGGGDFSIAEVTFVNTGSTGSYTVGCLVLTDETGCNTEVISVRANSSDTVPVPIYKSVPFVLDFTNFRDVDGNVMPTVSGSIEMGASGFSISGDGTITLKGLEEQ